MNLQSLVVVLLRLVSLNFLLQVCVELILKLTSITTAYQNLPRDEFRSALVTPLLVILGLSIGAVLLWVWATPLARFITRGLAPELSLGTLTLADCYALIFVAIGLFYAVGYLAAVLNWSHYLLKMEVTRVNDTWRRQVSWYDISRAFLTFIAGIVLLVNGRKWALALARKHTSNASASAPPNPDPRTPS